MGFIRCRCHVSLMFLLALLFVNICGFRVSLVINIPSPLLLIGRIQHPLIQFKIPKDLMISFSPAKSAPLLLAVKSPSSSSSALKMLKTIRIDPSSSYYIPKPSMQVAAGSGSSSSSAASGPESEEANKQPSIPVQVLQILVAMMVLDTWQYFVHRYMHHNKFLYRHVHSQHHRLVVPCAVGALYNHPLEGLLLDTLGGAISFVIAGMTPRTAVFFFCFATIKTVDDHCGIWHPANIFHIFFENNSAYHDIHHQLQGTKYNYSQPFFSVWDRVLGTHMPYRLVPRKEEGGGTAGYEARPLLKCCAADHR